jgi:N-acetylglucosamine-6-sulfatase
LVSARRRLLIVVIASAAAASTLVAVAVLAVGCSPSQAPAARGPSPGAAATASGGDRPLNVVLIVTDDQRADTLRFMPNVERLLAGHGVTFRNFFVTTPLCCPSRASILTGQYSRHTGVLDNFGPDGGAMSFDDHSTVSTWLANAGYTNALVGKYLNQYSALGRCYFPPGWDEWDARISEPQSHYFDYTLDENGRLVNYGRSPPDYSTTVITRKAVGFIDSTPEPFFLYLGTTTPHVPARTLPRDRGRFRGLSPSRPPSFDETDVDDKPWSGLIQPLGTSQIASADRTREHMIESLQALDRSVATLVRELRTEGRLGRTVILFTSDNGFLLGEHRLVSKIWPYEEALRVPLVIRVPWLASPRTDSHLALNIDLAPTIAELAGVRPSIAQDGRSLVPLMRGQGGSRGRNAFVVEWLGDHGADPEAPPPYEGIHTSRYVYVEYRNGWRELYDLARDPYELENLAEDPARTTLRTTLATELHRLLREPARPGT